MRRRGHFGTFWDIGLSPDTQSSRGIPPNQQSLWTAGSSTLMHDLSSQARGRAIACTLDFPTFRGRFEGGIMAAVRSEHGQTIYA